MDRMWIDVENSNEKVYTVDKIGAEKVDKKEKKEPKKRIIYLLFKKFTFIRSFFDEWMFYTQINFISFRLRRPEGGCSPTGFYLTFRMRDRPKEGGSTGPVQ